MRQSVEQYVDYKAFEYWRVFKHQRQRSYGIENNPDEKVREFAKKELGQDLILDLERQIEVAIASGINRNKIIIDPSIGFAKNYDQSLEILRRLSVFRSLDCPILVGPSRKSFIGRILNQPDPKARVWGTAAACCAAIASGANILRVHDVKEMRDVCRVADAIFSQSSVND